MTLIRLEFDIDGDVYPELVAALSAISSEASRAERIRQLAATGLIWEAVRLHGHPASLPVQAPVERRAPAAAAPPRKSPRAAPKPPARRRSDFVDLAIDAPPTGPQPLDDAPTARVFDREIDRAPRNVPVLFDVVEPEPPASLPLPPAPRPSRLDAPEPVEASAPPAAPVAPDFVAEVIDLDGPADDPAAQVAAASPSASKRSRLMRMKERGLFKNG